MTKEERERILNYDRSDLFGNLGRAFKGQWAPTDEEILEAQQPDVTSLLDKWNTQQQENLAQQTAANRLNTKTPLGTQTYWDDGFGNKGVTNEFSPEMQQASDLAQRQLIESLRSPLETGQQARDQATQAAYGQATSRLDPMWNKREEMARTRLLNQGLDPTSEAARGAMGDLGLQRNDAYSSAMNSAIGQGTAAGDSVFRNSLMGKQLPLQQMQGMFGLLGQPGYNAAGMAQTPDYLGMGQQQSGNAYQAYNDSQQRTADFWNNLLGLGTSAVGIASRGGR